MKFFLTPIKISIQNLLASKMRSLLTILGVIIGVAAVIIIFAAGKSAQELIVGRISDTGSNLIAILPGKSDENGPPAAVFGILTTTLTYDDFVYLTNPNNLAGVEVGTAFNTGTLNVSNGDTELASSVMGVTSGYIKMENTSIEQGRFFFPSEDESISKIAVIGPSLAKNLFNTSDVLGKKVKIKNQKFEIVGVFEPREAGGIGTGGQDDSIYIPIKTSQKLIYNVDYLNAIRLKAVNAEIIGQVEENIAEILRSRHNIDDPEDDDFSIRDLASAIGLIKDVTNIIRYFLLAVGSISLIVGGVGIMNIMLIAVNQRIREVGLRKAIGARDRDIRIQFLIESISVSLTGGILGIILGLSISFLIFLVANAMGYDWPFLISPISILFAVFVSISVGAIFGTYPAQKASKISPMEALRYE